MTRYYSSFWSLINHLILFLFSLLFFAGCGKGTLGNSLANKLTQGDWVSSGGERFKDANNPWWIVNTTQVKYCIDVDQDSFTASREMIGKIVEKALDDWRKEFVRPISFFEDTNKVLVKWNELGVGKQRFQKISCTGEEDLKLQFGYGTLTAPQREYLRDPLHFVAVAVRTSYDEKNLKGRGFIFVGSDIGPNRFAPDTQAERVWQSGAALYLAVIHELGHVFGLPHLGNRYSLMGAGILELFTHKAMATILGSVAMDYHQEFTFFSPKEHRSGCGGLPEEKALQWDYFGLADKQECLEFKFNASTREIAVTAYNERDRVHTDVGKIKSLNIAITSWTTGGVLMILNPIQNIFPTSYPTFPLAMMNGPFFVSGQGGANLALKSGEERPIQLRLGPEQFELSGVWNGKHRNILLWNPFGLN